VNFKLSTDTPRLNLLLKKRHGISLGGAGSHGAHHWWASVHSNAGQNVRRYAERFARHCAPRLEEKQLLLACRARGRQLGKGKLYYLRHRTLTSPEQDEIAISTGKSTGNLYPSIYMVNEITLEIQ
jgi:hypothetical protein